MILFGGRAGDGSQGALETVLGTLGTVLGTLGTVLGTLGTVLGTLGTVPRDGSQKNGSLLRTVFSRTVPKEPSLQPLHVSAPLIRSR